MVSIEDPFDQDDWDGYRPFTAAMGEKARPICGAWHLVSVMHLSDCLSELLFSST